MRLARLGPAGEERPAVIRRDHAVDVSQIVGDFDSRFWSEGGIGRLELILATRERDMPTVDLATIRMGPPLPKPSKVVCIGLNYLDHIREAQAETPAEPVIFMKAPNTVVGPNDDVMIPPSSEKTDYEVELAAVIGETCRYLPDEDAAVRAVAGYAVSNDLSEREYQHERGGQWVKGKSCETFNPLGPYLVTADEIGDPQQLDLELKVNGQVRQQSSTSQMVFTVAHLVWYLSQFMVLEPGDIVNTGTPHGVALGMDPPQYLQAGDVIEVSISGLGTQMQTCKQATP